MTNPADPNQPPPGYPPAPPPQGGPPPGYPAGPPQGPPPPGYPGAPPPAGYQPMPPPGYQQQGPPPGYLDRATQVGAMPPLPPGTELAPAGKRIGGTLLGFVLFIVTLGIGYFIWDMIAWTRGQTPAKQVLKMRIYHVQSQRAATWGQMFVRGFLGGIVNSLFFSIGLIVSLVFLFTDPLRRTIPDRMAGTIELNDPNNVLAPRKA